MIMIRDSAKFEPAIEVLEQQSVKKSPAKSVEIIGPLQSKCLNRDTHKGGLNQKPNDKCNIGWVFQNYGKQPWPENVRLVQVSGDDVGYT